MRLIRCLALLAVCAALASPALAARPYAADEIRARDGFPQCLTAPNRGILRYFAQNDPVWATMTYRYPHFENEPRFSGAGCVPSTIANCVVNLLPAEALPAIDRHSWRGEGFPICPCSMNLYDCDGTHDRFRIRQAADFERYFCLGIGAYMSGNNSEHALVCGTLSMTDELCGIYGLRCERAESMTAAAEAVARGALAVIYRARCAARTDRRFPKTGISFGCVSDHHRLSARAGESNGGRISDPPAQRTVEGSAAV